MGLTFLSSLPRHRPGPATEERISGRRGIASAEPESKTGCCLSESGAEKATLAEIAQRLGRKALEELAAVAKPNTLLA
jgi:hypothetical protein